jgi:CRISPR-associated endonuclease/helicase Cas3
MNFIAHIDESGRTHSLLQHLFDTSKLARTFADSFKSGDWAYLAALWHDLGKYSQKFQEKLTVDPSIRVIHSTAGAKYALKHFPAPDPRGTILAYLIAGHHAGLADFYHSDHPNASLLRRLEEQIEPYEANAPQKILETQVPLDPPQVKDSALWMRMLFSSLVDADFLNTEAFFDRKKSSKRGQYRNLQELKVLFDSFMKELQEKNPQTPLNKIRNEIYQQSLDAAQYPPGIYTMTVPTGGGKTLSSMAFALNHALKYYKERIIYVIPYTSIIEQNADVYRQIFGEDVLEHHSQFAPDDKENSYDRAKLAAENWDVPIVVTTTVQFFESLFAAKPSRTRKLHNIANSVVIIDEVQTLPPEYLESIYGKINALVSDYGVSFLLCSATMPYFASFETIEKRFQGLDNVQEIIEDPEALNQKLRRTELIWEQDEAKSYSQLAEEIIESNSSALVVVNTRDRARKLFETLKAMGEAPLHLSANMCGEHRSKTIRQIRKKLQEGERCIVVSTNLIEAGVDLDFPLLWREFAGLDSIAQAAGRCNREGKLPNKGLVRIFNLAEEKRPRYLEKPIAALQSILPQLSDPLSPRASQHYFAIYYKSFGEGLDQKKILPDEQNALKWPFRSVAEKFHLIEDGYTQSLLIPYDEQARTLLESLRQGRELSRGLVRKLQRYSINLPKAIIEKLKGSGEISEPVPGMLILENERLYREDLGFDERMQGIMDVESLYV